MEDAGSPWLERMHHSSRNTKYISAVRTYDMEKKGGGPQPHIAVCIICTPLYYTVCAKIDAIFYHENMCAMLLALDSSLLYTYYVSM